MLNTQFSVFVMVPFLDISHHHRAVSIWSKDAHCEVADLGVQLRVDNYGININFDLPSPLRQTSERTVQHTSHFAFTSSDSQLTRSRKVCTVELN